MKFEERYTLQVPLGETPRGTVWSARDERLKRPVVVAVVESDAPKGTATRFLHAWEPMVSARHPALPRLIESGITEDDAPFVAMELAEGESLAARLVDGPPLRVDHLTRALVEVSDGLAALHAKGGVHGDVEPSNVLLRERGGRLLPKIVGLGLGRAAVRTGDEPLEDDEHLPTLAYMSPKQASGHGAAPADDAYSMAAVLYSAVTGRLPHHGDSADAIRAHARDRSVPRVADVRPDLEGPLADVIDNALAADVSRRFPDCTSLSKALRAGLLKSRGLGGFHTELGERTLAPGEVVSKPRTMPPPRPVVSLPRPGAGASASKLATRSTLKGRPTLARPAPLKRPASLASPANPLEKRPTSPPPPKRSVSAAPPPRPDADVGFERLSGILELPDLDELAGPPPFRHAAAPSAPPPPPPAKSVEGSANKTLLGVGEPARRGGRAPQATKPTSAPAPSKKPTVPPPPPSPLGLQALGSTARAAPSDLESASDDGPAREPVAVAADTDTQVAGTSGEGAPESEGAPPAQGSEDDTPSDGSPEDRADDDGAVDDTEGAAGEPDADTGTADRDDEDDIDGDADGVAANAVGADDVDADDVDADKVDAGRVDADRVDADRVDADRVDADRVDAGDADADEPDADEPDVLDAEAGGSEPSDSEESDPGLAPPPFEFADGAPALAPLNLHGPSASDEVPRGAVPMWVWAVAGLVGAMILGGAMLWLRGGDGEAEPVVVGTDPSVSEPQMADVTLATEPAVAEPVIDAAAPDEPEPPPPEPIEVHLTGVPAGATVMLDGEPISSADVLSLDPAEASHVLRVMHEGFQPFEATLTPDSADPFVVRLEAVLAPEPRPASTGGRSSGRRSTASRRGTGSRSTGSRSTGSRTGSRGTGSRGSTGSRTGTGSSGRRRPVAVTDPGF